MTVTLGSFAIDTEKSGEKKKRNFLLKEKVFKLCRQEYKPFKQMTANNPTALYVVFSE